jgi:hypothetical protein
LNVSNKSYLKYYKDLLKWKLNLKKCWRVVFY